MKKVLKFIIIMLLMISEIPSLCYGQYDKRAANQDPFYDSLSHKYNNFKYVIEDLPYCVETDQNLDFYFSDLLIIQDADSILSDSSRWNRLDDRRCGDDISRGKYSLFCALVKASQDVVVEYLHRRTVMQEVRSMIVKYYRDRFNHHRLMDFNNNPKTTLKDIRFVLARSEEAIRKQLEEKEQILTVIHHLTGDVSQHHLSAIPGVFAKNSSTHYIVADHDSINSGKGTAFDSSQSVTHGIHETMSGLVSMRVNGDMGTAWVPYQLWDKTKLLYRGMKVFTLLKSGKGWKITSVNYTEEDNH